MGISRRIFTLLFVAFACISGMAQGEAELTAADSDPEATALLDELEAYVDARVRYKASFVLEMEFPGEETIIYNGHVDQQGGKYFIDAVDYRIYSNGTTRWVVTIPSEEVNIYSVSEEDGPSTPIDYLRIYRTEEFVYRLADEYAGTGERAVEFKPLDTYSDYSKIRLTLSAKEHKPLRVELFEKGGGKTTLRIESIEDKAPTHAAQYEFDPKAYPGFHIEDLRID